MKGIFILTLKRLLSISLVLFFLSDLLLGFFFIIKGSNFNVFFDSEIIITCLFTTIFVLVPLTISYTIFKFKLAKRNIAILIYGSLLIIPQLIQLFFYLNNRNVSLGWAIGYGLLISTLVLTVTVSPVAIYFMYYTKQ